MIFYMRTGVERELNATTQGVETIRIDTGSIVPRSNRKYIRQVLTQALGVKPQFVKYVMKSMDFWSAERLGVVDTKERHELYKKALAYEHQERSSV